MDIIFGLLIIIVGGSLAIMLFIAALPIILGVAAFFIMVWLLQAFGRMLTRF